MMCEACERDDHVNCGMQTWCECDCAGYHDAGMPELDIDDLLEEARQQTKEAARKELAGERIDSDLMDFRMTEPIIFTNCNVCGIKLRTEDEFKMGMCERCSNE